MRLLLIVAALCLSACALTPSEPWSVDQADGEPLRPPLAGAALSVDGLGPLRVGARMEDVNALLHAELQPVAADGDCEEYSVIQAPSAAIALLARGSRVVRITTFGNLGIRTPEGIGIGSTAAEVRVAYPNPQRVAAEYYEEPAHELYVWRDTDSWIGTFFRIDEQERVAEISVGGELRNIEGCTPSP